MENPQFYRVPEDASLWARYERVGLKDNRANQFERICEATVSQ